MARIVIAGQSQCEVFARACLVADHLSETLPNFCYDRIEKPVWEWDRWLSKINQKNNWHHLNSPLIWKECLMKGSKSNYIGGASDFLDYCYSYYKFDFFLAPEKFKGVIKNFKQYEVKERKHKQFLNQRKSVELLAEAPIENQFNICISGVSHPLTMHLLSGLLELSVEDKHIGKIFMYDDNCTNSFMESVEDECSYIQTIRPKKVIKYVKKIGLGLALSDLFIIMDHVPFDENIPIGSWLAENKKVMEKFASMINASASSDLRILLPNLGPACYNATVLKEAITNIDMQNIVVATSDLGLEILPVVAQIAEIPMKNIFCPPVWGFVGINHLVDIRTTVHKYYSFEPYSRYTKVRNSTLTIGAITPELRKLEYLFYIEDDELWNKVAVKQNKFTTQHIRLNKVVALLNVIKVWLLDPDSNHTVNLGVVCNGSFGLEFNGIFSQPSRLKNGFWEPAADFMLPKDSQMKLPYLEYIANMMMSLTQNELPNIVPHYPCTCKKRKLKKRGIWW